MILLKRILLIFFILFIFTKSYSKEVLEVCATYENSGKTYSVEAVILKGSELNTETQSFDYNGLSTYAVIFWSNEQVTIIEFDLFLSLNGYVDTRGKDQKGRSWGIRKKNGICF